MENLEINIWEKLSRPFGEVNLEDIFDIIRDGKYKTDIEKYRKSLRLYGKKESEQIKKSLISFTISGRFLAQGGRSLENLEQYYGWMILDYDGDSFDEEVYKKIFENVKNISHTKFAFRSPSGNGIKIIVKTNNDNFKIHSECYKKLLKYYESELSVKFDASTCDVSRLCFFSYDPDIYYNEDSEVFTFSTEEKVKEIHADYDIFSFKMEEMINFTSNRQKYKVGNRNNFLKLLIMNCSNHALNESEVLEFCLGKYVEEDFDEFEITMIVEKTYKTYKSDFGSWKNRLDKAMRDKSKSQKEKKEPELPIKNITFEDEIFQKYYDELSETFPKRYTDFIKCLKTEREKNIVILTMMTVLNSIYQIK